MGTRPGLTTCLGILAELRGASVLVLFAFICAPRQWYYQVSVQILEQSHSLLRVKNHKRLRSATWYP